MSIYNPKSMKAEEFINDIEIRETIAYAQANKNNVELIDSLLEKARPVKNGSGVTCSATARRRCCSPARYPRRSRRCISSQMR